MKIFCVGRNYAAHAKELNNPVPKRPLIFSKPHTALLIRNKPFYYPDFTQEVHHEVELVLKICKNGKHISKRFARKYYNKIAIGIDFTARDLQRELKAKGHPWEIAKGFDRSAPISEFVPIEELGNINDIPFSLHKNGEVIQHGSTKDLLFSFDQLISYISQFFTLQMGDYIFTGTPEGVGEVQIGDRLEAFIGERSMLKCAIK